LLNKNNSIETELGEKIERKSNKKRDKTQRKRYCNGNKIRN